MKNLFNNHHFVLILGVIAISFSPLAVKVVTFSSSVSAFYRSFYAAIFFLIFALWKQKTFINNKLWILPSILAGIFLGIDLILWHKTIIYLGAGPATFLGNSQIIFVSIFAAIVFKEDISKIFYIFVAIILSGLYMLLPSHPACVSLNVGYIMGLFVGLTYAGMLISLRYAKMNTKENYPELWSLFYVFLTSAITIAFYVIIFECDNIISGDIKSHVLMILTSFFAQTIGWYFITVNISKVLAHEGSLVLMLQPVLATIWGMCLFNETLTLFQALGIVMSLFGIIIYQIYFAKK